jgi:hypothetical protein
MESYIKLFELMKYNNKKYNGTVRSTKLNHKSIEKALSKNYSLYKFYSLHINMSSHCEYKRHCKAKYYFLHVKMFCCPNLCVKVYKDLPIFKRFFCVLSNFDLTKTNFNYFLRMQQQRKASFVQFM